MFFQKHGWTGGSRLCDVQVRVRVDASECEGMNERTRVTVSENKGLSVEDRYVSYLDEGTFPYCIG